MFTQEQNILPDRLEPKPKSPTVKKARPTQPSAKVAPTILVVPDIVTAKDLRAAVILSEILRPPLALREPDES